ncbi:MAG TPA: D-alanyl-D-alanine carboxypeptidase/D-alanyl-D-alanine-endopeptidase, partial [Acidobacteriota bacterium]
TYAPPIFPLSYSFNAFSIRINGNSDPGRTPDVWIMPDLPSFHVVNNASVTTKGRTELSIQVIDPAPDGRIAVMVDGRIRAGETFQDYRTVQRPAEYFLSAFFDELHKQGVETSLAVRAGEVPAQANILVAQESLPLGVLVRFMNLHSNNFMAELLLRQVGGFVFGPPGSTEKGARAVQLFMQETGIPPAELQQWDGSGLSRCDRSTAMAIARLCLALRARYDIGPDFMASLSTNGGEGTLAKQIPEPEYYRRFRAKNGALRGVYTAGGYLATLSGKQLIVAFMLNNAALPFALLQEIGNEIVKTVVNY